MRITCDNCHTRYNLDTGSLNKPVIKVRCANCNHRFEVRRETEGPPPSSATGEIKPWRGCRVIAVSNQKGGVAKTSTCLNLGVALAQMQRKVLLIDFDVQANLTTSLGLPAGSRSFFDILRDGRESITTSISRSNSHGVDVLPSNSRMALLGKHYMYRPGFESLLRERLKLVRDKYDAVLVDTPPALDFCTLNALAASDLVIIPTPCEYLSMHGIHKIANIIKAVQQKSGHGIDYRILITMHDPRSTASQVICRKIKDLFGDKVLQSVVEKDEKIKESQIVHQPVITYDGQSPSARQYMALAEEMHRLFA